MRLGPCQIGVCIWLWTAQGSLLSWVPLLFCLFNGCIFFTSPFVVCAFAICFKASPYLKVFCVICISFICPYINLTLCKPVIVVLLSVRNYVLIHGFFYCKLKKKMGATDMLVVNFRYLVILV